MSKTIRKTFPKAYHRGAIESQPRSSQLRTVTARVRSIELTPLGHVSCMLDTPAGRLKALSDAATVHLPELRTGTQVQAVLLRFHRATPDAVWHWQLLCCRALQDAPAAAARTEEVALTDAPTTHGSRA